MEDVPFETDALKNWFVKEKRDLPWRDQPNAYKVWISEIMLQQTQVSVVIEYFIRWMHRFPTLSVLAEASVEEVLKMWEGLGYYSRARHLHAAARYFLERHEGNIPPDREELEKMKGLGPYTVGAILSFAFHQKAPAVDANVVRVLARYFCIEEDVSKSQVRKRIWAIAEQILPQEESWILSEALIELGAVVCTVNPKCILCPIKKGCESYRKGIQTNIPVKRQKKTITFIRRHVAVIHYQGEWLLKKGASGKVMADLYEFPYFDENEAILDGTFPFALHFERKLPTQHHSFTRFKVELLPILWMALEKNEVLGYQWVDQKTIHSLPFSSGHRRILHDLENERVF